MPIFRSAKPYYCIWFSALDVLAGVLGSREVGRVHCVEDVIRHSTFEHQIEHSYFWSYENFWNYEYYY